VTFFRVAPLRTQNSRSLCNSVSTVHSYFFIIVETLSGGGGGGGGADAIATAGGTTKARLSGDGPEELEMASLLESGKQPAESLNHTVNLPAASTSEVIDPFLLCGAMGAIESVLLIAYNAVLCAREGVDVLLVDNVDKEASVASILFIYACLVLCNFAHAATFFTLIRAVGAVTSAVLKGLQVVCVFIFSAVVFCERQASQCATPTKALAMLLVVTGLVIYSLDEKVSILCAAATASLVPQTWRAR
jgi:hypothetical protein